MTGEDHHAQTQHMLGKLGLWVSVPALAGERLFYHSSELFWVTVLTIIISAGVIPAPPRPPLE